MGVTINMYAIAAFLSMAFDVKLKEGIEASTKSGMVINSARRRSNRIPIESAVNKVSASTATAPFTSEKPK